MHVDTYCVISISQLYSTPLHSHQLYSALICCTSLSVTNPLSKVENTSATFPLHTVDRELVDHARRWLPSWGTNTFNNLSLRCTNKDWALSWAEHDLSEGVAWVSQPSGVRRVPVPLKYRVQLICDWLGRRLIVARLVQNEADAASVDEIVRGPVWRSCKWEDFRQSQYLTR